MSMPWYQVCQLWDNNLRAASALKRQHRFLRQWKCQMLGFGAWVFWLASLRRMLLIHLFQWGQVWARAQGINSIPFFVFIWIHQDKLILPSCLGLTASRMGGSYIQGSLRDQDSTWWFICVTSSTLSVLPTCAFYQCSAQFHRCCAQLYHVTGDAYN